MAGKIDLTGLSLMELETLADDVASAIVAQREAVKAELRERFAKDAEAAGLTLAEVTGAKKGKRSSAAVVKYRDPQDASKTWTGKGRKPAWLKERLDGGAKLEDFAI